VQNPEDCSFASLLGKNARHSRCAEGGIKGVSCASKGISHSEWRKPRRLHLLISILDKVGGDDSEKSLSGMLLSPSPVRSKTWDFIFLHFLNGKNGNKAQPNQGYNREAEAEMKYEVRDCLRLDQKVRGAGSCSGCKLPFNAA
jgi:hypothetical protein